MYKTFCIFILFDYLQIPISNLHTSMPMHSVNSTLKDICFTFLPSFYGLQAINNNKLSILVRNHGVKFISIFESAHEFCTLLLST